MGNVPSMNVCPPARTPPSGWFKSTFSDHGNACVEVRFTPGAVLIRDSKYSRDPNNDPATQPVITVPLTLWPSFLDRALGYTTPDATDLPTVERHLDGSATLLSGKGIRLEYTAPEWQAYTAGIQAGEFAAA